jgi:hypothetical protein
MKPGELGKFVKTARYQLLVTSSVNFKEEFKWFFRFYV